LYDFEELHNEANKISALNNRLKGLTTGWKTELANWKNKQLI